ncbi:MAG: hypothetical protein P8X64_08425 [Anaerolineales bacterium]
MNLNSSEQLNRLSIWLSLAGGSSIVPGELLDRIEQVPIDGIALDFVQDGSRGARSSSEQREARRLAHLGLPAGLIRSRLQLRAVRETADLLLPVFERSNGLRGLLSVPLWLPQEASSRDLSYAVEELWDGINRPNLVVALACSPAGLEAFYTCLVKGINLELRSILTLQEFNQVRQLQNRAIHKRTEKGQATGHIIAGAAIDLASIDRVVDAHLARIAEADDLQGERAEWLRGKAALATADLILAQQDASVSDGQLHDSISHRMYVRWAETEREFPSTQAIPYREHLFGTRSILTVDPGSIPDAARLPAVEHEYLRDISVSRAQMEAIGNLGIDIEAAMVSERERLARVMQSQEEQAIDRLDEQVRTYQAELGDMAVGLEDSLARLQAQEINRRLWESERVADREAPNWLGLPQEMSTRVRELAAWVNEEFEAHRFEALVLVGAHEQTFPLEMLLAVTGHRMDVRILDRLDPTRCRTALRSLEPDRTAALILDWDSEHLESQYLFTYLWNWFESKLDDPPEEYFAALARPGSKLHELALQHGFHAMYSRTAVPEAACGPFNLESILPAMIAGIDAAPLLTGAREMVERCSLSAEPAEHPGLYLAAILDAVLMTGRTHLTILSDPAADPFRRWLVKQLEFPCGSPRCLWSTISAEPPARGMECEKTCALVYLRVTGGLDKQLDGWREAGNPVLIFQLDATPGDTGAAVLQWQYAVAAVVRRNGLDRTKRRSSFEARRTIDGLLKNYSQKGEFEPGWPLPEEGCVRIIGQSLTEIPGDLPLSAFWEEFMLTIEEHEGMRLNLFLHPPAGIQRRWKHIQRLLQERGRYWASLEIGRLGLSTFEAGEESAVQLILSVRKTKDITVPGIPWSFNTIQRARARAALSQAASSESPAVHVELTSKAAFKPWLEALKSVIERGLDEEPAA